MVLIPRIYPLAAPAILRVLGPDSPEVEVLQEEETESVLPPAILPGMLERVTGTDELGVLSYHMEAVQATVVTHAPVLRRVYRGATVRRGGYATLRTSERYGSFNMKQLAGPVAHVPTLRFCQTFVSHRFFGHWLTDSISAARIEPDLGAAWLPPDPAWGHAPAYLDVFGLPAQADQVAYAEELVVYQDHGQGSSKRARYAAMHETLQARFAGPERGDLVYLRRGATGAKRAIVNEAALIEALVARNWTIVDLASSSVEDLQRALCPAHVVVSLDGSHLTHAQLALRPGSTMIALVPNDRFTTLFAGYSLATRLNFGMVIAQGEPEAGYHVDLDEVLRTVDLAEGRAYS